MNKRHVLLAVKILVSGGLIWVIVGAVDFQAASDKFLSANLKFISLATFFFIIQVMIGVIRWSAILVAIDAFLALKHCLRFCLIGIFFNQGLPSAFGGDAVRVYLTYKHGLNFFSAINGVILERATTVLTLVPILLLSSPFFIDKMEFENATWFNPTVYIFSISTIVGLSILMFLDRLVRQFPNWRFIEALAILARDTRKVFLTRHSTRTLGWSLLGHVNVCLVVYFLGLSLQLKISWLECLVLFPPVLLVITIPVSIAGWGVREGAMVAALGLIGVPVEGAVVLSIMYGLLGLLPAIPGGLFWLVNPDKKVEPIGKISKNL